MKVAYLLFAYRNPKLIKKTIDHLACEESSFFVHIDSKSDINEFAGIAGERVFFSEKRLPVYWAEFSGVEAVMLLIRQALASPERFDYFVLLSGSEYALRSREYIHHFLETNRGAEFMTMVKVPGPGKPLSRINTIRYPSSRAVPRFIFRALAKFGLGQRDWRKHLGNLEPYSGMTWWALSREACQYVVEFQDRDPRLSKYLENVFAPEEVYFHTILGNSPFRSRMRRNLLYEDWSQEGARPEMITEKHCEMFEAQDRVSIQDIHGPGEALFARKFSDESLGLVARIDAMIQRKEKTAGQTAVCNPQK
jgi:hypothetical protein